MGYNKSQTRLKPFTISSESNCSVITVNIKKLWLLGLYRIFAYLFGNIIVNISQLKGIHLSEYV